MCLFQGKRKERRGLHVPPRENHRRKIRGRDLYLRRSGKRDRLHPTHATEKGSCLPSSISSTKRKRSARLRPAGRKRYLQLFAKKTKREALRISPRQRIILIAYSRALVAACRQGEERDLNAHSGGKKRRGRVSLHLQREKSPRDEELHRSARHSAGKKKKRKEAARRRAMGAAQQKGKKDRGYQASSAFASRGRRKTWRDPESKG